MTKNSNHKREPTISVDGGPAIPMTRMPDQTPAEHEELLREARAEGFEVESEQP